MIIVATKSSSMQYEQLILNILLGPETEVTKSSVFAIIDSVPI